MMINRATLYLTIAIAIAAVKSSAAWAAAPLPAFQGAEGFGAYTPGGRGGQVIAVTNLNDSGPGSLRAAIETQGPRIVVFGVSGYIDLEKPLRISHPYITIAGQTAPGDGVCLRNYQSRGHSGQRAPVLRIGRGAQQAGKTGSYAPVQTDEAQRAYDEVLLNVGAVLPVRDEVDTRIVAGVRAGSGRIHGSLSDLGGWPDLEEGSAPTDTDRDGMPDPWEMEHDLDPADALDASGDADGDGYTNIEEYLNGSDPIARQTSIEEKPQATRPTDFALAQNYPNPFNSETVIRFSLPEEAMATLAVYNLAGQHLNTLVSAKRIAGVHAVHWDGRDATGSDLASGAYIYQLEAGALSRSRKLLMLR